jgi:hypothetical protein
MEVHTMVRYLRAAILFAFFIARAATNAQSRRTSNTWLRETPASVVRLVSGSVRVAA